MGAYDDYNSLVGFEQGAERIFVKENGKINVNGNDIAGSFMNNFLYPKTKQQTIVNSAGVLSTVTVPENVGVVFYNLGDAASNASAVLGNPGLGEEKILYFTGGSVGSVLFAPSTGVSLVGFKAGGNGALSTISMRHSAASHAVVKLLGISASCWAVIDEAGNVTQRPNA
jgi:hypothetical protein